MPSSLLFAGLVATWLAVLVPMAARRRQPMSRPSDAALSCRVLERPRRRDSEVTAMDASNSAAPNSVTPNISGPNISGSNSAGPNDAGPNDAAPDEDAWSESSEDTEDYADQRHAERSNADHGYADTEYADHGYAAGPERRFQRGRGGYDAEAAAAAAQARYVVRQRLVLALVLLAVATGLLAGGLHLADGWYLHAGVDLCLVGYLAYLRRQVRVEQAIRARRAARMAGSRYRADADLGSPLLDDPRTDDPHRPGVRHTAGPMVRRGPRSRAGRRPTVGEAVAAREAARRRAEAGAAAHGQPAGADPDAEYEDDYDEYGYDEADGADGVDGGDGGDGADGPDEPDEPGDDERAQQSALPRLRPSALPERPRGTVVLELDDEDPELHDLDSRPERGYRRAAGQ
ncbi:MAG TPA: gephyrin-like molybdotransferase receptor GlpR [Pseudonocardia sp.]|nr:gephyrin-like molybdotransferase receptor GlpR [Pseudonocardia sp.]